MNYITHIVEIISVSVFLIPFLNGDATFYILKNFVFWVF